jgi:hypothetical protein
LPAFVGGLALAAFMALPAAGARLGNISTRMQVLDGANVMIAGFFISGTANKTVVITAKGPSLTAFNVPNALPDPSITIVRMSDSATIATNDNWETDSNAAQLQASGFAPSHPLESAVLRTLAPGAYTAIVSGALGTTGVGLVEVYEVDHPDSPLMNISTRGQVRTGADVMIGGFVVQGNEPRQVVITARGPSLAQYGIANPLNNPTLTVVRASDNSIIATNDNWENDPNAAAIVASGYAPSNNQESAVLLTLDPGAYTALVSGVGNTTGVGIIEVWAYDNILKLANPNTSAIHSGFVGQVYSYPLPGKAPNQIGSGFLQQGDNPGTPTELTVEWAISKSPGDFDYYKSAEAKVNGSTPCGGVNGAVGGSYYWSLTGSFYECKVDLVNTWYLNVRYINNCPVGVKCPVSYYHSEW